MDYKAKYLKYKIKYLNLVEQSGGTNSGTNSDKYSFTSNVGTTLTNTYNKGKKFVGDAANTIIATGTEFAKLIEQKRKDVNYYPNMGKSLKLYNKGNKISSLPSDKDEFIFEITMAYEQLERDNQLFKQKE